MGLFFRFLSLETDKQIEKMPLSLLARDSIQDLENFGRGTTSSSNNAALVKKDNVVQVEDEASNPASDSNNATTQDSRTNDAHTAAAAGGGSSSFQPTPSTSSPSGVADNLNGQSSPDSKKKKVDSTVDSASSSSYGQYSGFRHDYYSHDLHNDSYYYHDTYASPFVVGRRKSENGMGFWKGLLPCLFPWTSAQGRLVEDPEKADGQSGGSAAKRTASKDEDERSNSSEIMGEKLSEKERMAVLNRLRLGQPDAVQSDHSSLNGSDEKEKKKGLLNGVTSYETTEGGKIKGILKNMAPKPPPAPSSSSSNKATSSDQVSSAAHRRSLFPQYSGVGSFYSSTNDKGVNVSFAPMARVVTVKSRNDMDQQEKSDIWWQKADYDDFRKTGRIITRAMAEGGSEIWLSSQTDVRSKDDKDSNKDDPADTISAQGDKWWHEFGHSRRGLEHVVSMDEGRQRQLNVKRAIHATLEEQARQKLSRRQDPEKLRHVSMQYTSWARDLSLASGASDADAVESKFADDRKSREFYLLKIARNSPAKVTARHIPDFMQPALQAAMSPRLSKKGVPSPHVLDANTAAQIRYRRKALQKDEPKKEEETCEPVHDSERNEPKRESIAQRAAGFSADENDKVNMAAVLSGMGAVPQNAQVVSTA